MESGSSLYSVSKKGRQGKIWNSRIAFLAVASHPLHQEKNRREVGFVPLRAIQGGAKDRTKGGNGMGSISMELESLPDHLFKLA